MSVQWLPQLAYFYNLHFRSYILFMLRLFTWCSSLCIGELCDEKEEKRVQKLRFLFGFVKTMSWYWMECFLYQVLEKWYSLGHPSQDTVTNYYPSPTFKTKRYYKYHVHHNPPITFSQFWGILIKPTLKIILIWDYW